MAEQTYGPQTPRLPPLSSPVKQLHTQLSLTRTRHLPPTQTQRKLMSSAKQQKVICNFLIRYLERKEQLSDKDVMRTVLAQDKKAEASISPHFRRAMIRLRHTPRKPLQTRFLIANHDSISFA